MRLLRRDAYLAASSLPLDVQQRCRVSSFLPLHVLGRTLSGPWRTTVLRFRRCLGQLFLLCALPAETSPARAYVVPGSFSVVTRDVFSVVLVLRRRHHLVVRLLLRRRLPLLWRFTLQCS